MKIYHNPRCSKSRQGLAILEASNQPFQVIKYLETPISENELSEIVKLLGIKPIQLIRKNESIWKENYKNKNLSDSQLIKVMVANPKLIERPIVINNGKAIIGRPPQLIENIL
jgi:arsenate reductase